MRIGLQYTLRLQMGVIMLICELHVSMLRASYAICMVTLSAL